MRFLSALAVLSFPLLAFGQCPNGRCVQPDLFAPFVFQPAPAAIAAVPLVECEWQEGDPKTSWRFKVDGKHIGTLDETTGLFSAVNGKRWRFDLQNQLQRPMGELPIGIPSGGIVPEQVAPDGHGGFSISGKPVNAREAFESLNSTTLLDDSKHLRLTILGTDDDRAKVMRDLANIRDAADLVIKDYRPDRWEVAGLGFVTKGTPTIYIQAPSGKVLHRQDDYDGPERLVGAIRKARQYDASIDRDLRNPAPQPDPVRVPQPMPPPDPQPGPQPLNLDWLIIGAVLVGLVLFGRSAPTK